MNKLQDQSGSILLAVFILLSTIAIIFSAIIVYGAWHKANAKTLIYKTRAEYLAEAGIHHAIWKLKNQPNYRCLPTRESVGLNSYYEYEISVWGGYFQIKSKGVSANVHRNLRAKVGTLPPKLFDNVVATLGEPYPLVIAGDTRIVGDALLPPSGITQGIWKGRRGNNKQLIDGNIKTVGNGQLPQSSTTIIMEFQDSLNSWESMCQEKSDLALEILSKEQLISLKKDKFYTSSEIIFKLPNNEDVIEDKEFYSGQTSTVSGSTNLSRVIISSKKKVVIAGNSILNDCIIVAPEILLIQNSKFNGQIIAHKQLSVADNAVLSDFSSVYLLGELEKSELSGDVQLTSNSKLNCFLFHSLKFHDFNNRLNVKKDKTKITINENCNLNGIIWSEAYVELLGSVNGSIAANVFYFYDPPTKYLNWLINSELIYDADIRKQILPLVFADNYKYEIKGMTAF